MNAFDDSTDRRPGDYILFALGFLAFLLVLWGIILTTSPLAFAGLCLWLLVALAFFIRPTPG